MLLHESPGKEFLGLIVAGFHPETLRDAIFDFVRVGAGGVGVKADELEEIVDAGDIAIGDVRLDGVLVPPTAFSLVGGSCTEETFQGRGAKIESEFAVVARQGLSTNDTKGSEGRSVVGGAKSGGRGGAEPWSEMERHRDTGR